MITRNFSCWTKKFSGCDEHIPVLMTHFCIDHQKSQLSHITPSYYNTNKQ